jgi:hypothetical protein
MTLHFARVTGYGMTVSAPGMDEKTESQQRLGAI